MKPTLMTIGLVVTAIALLSALSLVRAKTVWRLMQFVGAAFLLVMVITHLAEELNALPGMGWECDTPWGIISTSLAPS